MHYSDCARSRVTAVTAYPYDIGDTSIVNMVRAERKLSRL